MTSAHEEMVPKTNLQLTELLLRTDVGKSFYLETQNPEDAVAVMRSVHARTAHLTKMAVKAKTKKLKCVVDADPAIPGDIDRVELLIKVTILSRSMPQ